MGSVQCLTHYLPGIPHLKIYGCNLGCAATTEDHIYCCYRKLVIFKSNLLCMEIALILLNLIVCQLLWFNLNPGKRFSDIAVLPLFTVPRFLCGNTKCSYSDCSSRQVNKFHFMHITKLLTANTTHLITCIISFCHL